eukprot:COSAG02_NODE_3718_length_6328_cov_3.336009_3_plen_379_part_01
MREVDVSNTESDTHMEIEIYDIDPDTDSDSEDSELRGKYKPFDEVEVYSKRAATWCTGIVKTVDSVAGTVKVEYKNSTGAMMQKVLMTDSEDLRWQKQYRQIAVAEAEAEPEPEPELHSDDGDEDDYEGREVASLPGRVFLRPQYLVDVMKEFVHHDLDQQLRTIDPEDQFGTLLGEEVEVLAELFLRRGKLSLELLPWLWRNLNPPIASDDETHYLMDLLEQQGLLTPVPHSNPRQWLLPMRVPSIQPAKLPWRHSDDGSASIIVTRYMEFHQPVPSGMLAVAISRFAKIAGPDTQIWRAAILTRMRGLHGAEIEIGAYQEGRSGVAFVARCKAEAHGCTHHDLLDKLRLFEGELYDVIAAQWPGSSVTVYVVAQSGE